MEQELSKRERQLLDVLYTFGEASATQVRESLADDLADPTVRTILNILEGKGLVSRRLIGKKYVYRPVKPKVGAGKLALKRVLDVFFGGAVEDAIAAHLTDPKTVLSKNQVAKLRKLINEARKEGE